ncbi:General transcription factor II-I repeat domain-containing protein 2A, partial [Lamellibrachia satsuma]
CFIHQENLCGKSVKMQNVMSVVVKTVNFVRARGLNHRQFQHLLAEMNAQYQDLLYYCEVRWLSRGVMLCRVYELRNEISLFMEQKGTEVPEFADPTWMCDFAFLIDVTAHLNQLNVQLQGREHLINELFQFVSVFEMKLRLWETQLRNANYVHFPTLMENE